MERKLIAAAVTSALAVPMAAQAVEFAVSGHVNRAVIIVDQDQHAEDGDLQHVDSNASGTRFRFKGSEELDGGLTAGVNLELGVGSTTSRRHASVHLDSAGGKLTIGQTDIAAGGAEDAAGAFAGVSFLGGVTNWCTYANEGSACVTDGVARLEVLRYDTPAIGPAKISVSAGNNEHYDAKLVVSGAMGDAGYDFRIGYWQSERDATRDADALLTSGAVSFGQGTSIGASWVQTNLELDTTGLDTADKEDDSDDIKPFGDHLKTWNLGTASTVDAEFEAVYFTANHSYGDGNVGIYYRKGEATGAANKLSRSTDGDLWGIGIGHTIGAGVDAYAGFRQIKEEKGIVNDDLNLYVVGMRVSFN